MIARILLVLAMGLFFNESMAFGQKNPEKGQVSIDVRIMTLPDSFIERMGISWSENDNVKYLSLSDSQLFMLCEAPQGDQATHIMQLPKATLFDGQDASVDVGDWQTYRTGVDVQVKGTKTFYVPKQEKFFTGIKTRMLPTISADRKQVRLQAEMVIRQLTSNPTVPMSIPPPVPNEDATFQMMVEKPSFTEVRVAIAAKVPDQRTIAVLAGKSVSEKRTENGPPILSKIPYLNRLYRNTAIGRESTVTILLLTPRILSDADEVQVERLRNGFQTEVSPPS